MREKEFQLLMEKLDEFGDPEEGFVSISYGKMICNSTGAINLSRSLLSLGNELSERNKKKFVESVGWEIIDDLEPMLDDTNLYITSVHYCENPIEFKDPTLSLASKLRDLFFKFVLYLIFGALVIGFFRGLFKIVIWIFY